MATRRVINGSINYDLVGGSFKNSPSQTIFNLGDFSLETNLSNRNIRNYNNVLGVFVEPITLENINLTVDESITVSTLSQRLLLNYDKTDLNNYAKFGSLAEYIRISIEEIILKFPAGIFVDYISDRQIYNTVNDYSYDQYSNTATFRTPIAPIENNFGLIYDYGNSQYPDGLEIRNLNLSYNLYSIFRNSSRTTEYNIIGFTGYTDSSIYFQVSGNPFTELTVTTGLTTLSTTFHVKPNFSTYNKLIKDLSDFEEFLLANKSIDGYTIKLKIPQQNDKGESVLVDTEMLWPTSDGYNIDISGSEYGEFLQKLYNVGIQYDDYKTDLIYRFLTPVSLKSYDLTSDQKVSKLLRVYGREFDEIKRFIDSISYLNKVSYDKKNNIPDVLIKNFARVFGWDTFNLVDENDLLKRFFGDSSSEDSEAYLPAEVDIELWRRIVLNTNYFWKSKGTREAIRSMFLFLGIPDSLISINEYVYTVDEKINPDEIELAIDIRSISNPYNSEGYPISPLEDSRFYFQLSGNTDGGNAYMDNFRNVGFKLNRTVDNKKSWMYTGATVRNDTDTNYTQNDSRLVINTKEVDVSFDIARGIEYEFYNYNSLYNYPISSTGVTMPFLYINIPLDITGSSQTNFIIPEEQLGDIQVNINGITLAMGSIPGENDYYINPINEQEIILNVSAYKNYVGYNDTISVTYTADRSGTLTTATVRYVVTKFAVTSDGQTVFTLPKEPAGDVQLSLNGLSLTKGIGATDGDYFINPSNRKEVIIKSATLGAYLKTTDTIVISYLEINDTSILVEKYSDFYRVTTLFDTNFYYNTLLNKFTYIMQYSAFNESAIKVILNGITLTNGVDFTLSSTNKKQIFFNAPLRIGDTINIFYYISTGSGGLGVYSFSDGSIASEMTFLEFINKITQEFIDARDRKIVTNYEGGYYPTLSTLYDLYYVGLTQSGTTFLNNYNFIKLYKYLNNFNGYFQTFVTQLLPATAILRKGGISIRNTIFHQQKFVYKAGYYGSGISDYGSEFVTSQDFTNFGFGFGVGLNSPLYTALKLDDGYLIGGDFTTYSGNTGIVSSNRIINLNARGYVNRGFSIGTGFNGIVYDINNTTDGKYLVTGNISLYNGSSIYNIIKLNTDGSVDSTFNVGNGLNNVSYKTIIQSDNKIVSVGEFTTYSGVSKSGIVRLNTGGTIDETFQIGSGFNVAPYIIKQQLDDKILVGGQFTTYSGVTKSKIIRLNTGGTIDETFQIGSGFSGGDTVLAIEQQSDGKILVGGDLESYSGLTINNFIRLNSNGSYDNTFQIGFDDTVRVIKQQSDGKILVGGDFTTYSGSTSPSGSTANRIIRLNIDGSTDTVFSEGFDDYVLNILINSDDDIVIMGNFNSYNEQEAYNILRINNEGIKVSD